MKKNVFTKLLAFTLAAVMALSLCACGGGSKQTEEEGKVTITVGYTADYEATYKKLIAAFNEKYPDIKVVSEIIPGSMKGQITQMTTLAA